MAMHIVLGLAGLAEGALSISLLILWGALFITGLLLLLAFETRSWGIAIVPVCLNLLTGWFFKPWTMLEQVSDKDPDAVLWMGRFRFASQVWCFIAIASVVLLVSLLLLLLFRKKFNAETQF